MDKKVFQWQKCQNYIKDYISKNKMKEGEELPTDKEFAEQFHCSIQPVIRAMNELVRFEIVERSPGTRTKVGKFEFKKSLSFNASNKGFKVINRQIWLDLKSILDLQLSNEILNFFKINEDSKVTTIKRARNLVPINKPDAIKPGSVQTVFLNPEVVKYDTIKMFNLEDASLINIYNHLGFSNLRRNVIIKAVELPAELQNFFKVKSSVPVLEVKQETKALFNKNIVALEYMHGFYAPEWEYSFNR